MRFLWRGCGDTTIAIALSCALLHWSFSTSGNGAGITGCSDLYTPRAIGIPTVLLLQKTCLFCLYNTHSKGFAIYHIILAQVGGYMPISRTIEIELNPGGYYSGTAAICLDIVQASLSCV